MSPVVTVELEWNYSPSDYLEEPLNLEYDGVIIDLQEGKGIARIAHRNFEKNPSMQEELHQFVESRFHAVLIFNHKDFELSKSTRTDIREDGGKHYYLQVESIVSTCTFGSVDLIVKDKDGNIKSDSKRDRLEKQRWYADAMDKHRKTDPTLNQLFTSYQMSVKDPENEFVHLYEIRDALQTRFNSKKSALRELNITKSQWDQIGMLANSLPLKQGRHRGQTAGLLRSANSSELEEGRKAVVKLMEKYIEYLEK